MREILFRGKRCDNNAWVEGAFCMKDCDSPFGKMVDIPSIIKYDPPFDGFWFCVYPETVGQFTGVYDTELIKIYEGDIVRFLRYVCTVVFEEGCFGLALNINDAFDWDYIDEEMKEYAGINQFTACFNDHFISLWEILWNFNCDQNICNVVEVIGNIHDNPELLENITHQSQ